MSKEERTCFGSPSGRGRWSAKRKTAAVVRLLRGEDIESLSRELGVTAATPSGWRDQFLAGGEGNLKTRETDVENEETQRLKCLVADLGMSNELLRENIHRMEAGHPLAAKTQDLWRNRSEELGKNGGGLTFITALLLRKSGSARPDNIS